MLKSTSQFRNPHHLSQGIFLHVRVQPNIDLQGFVSEKPGPHKPGSEKNDGTLFIHDRYPSTERKSFSNLENKKPDLGGSGLTAMIAATDDPPIIAYPEIKASGFPLCTETFMSERFVKCIDGIETDYLVTANPHAFALSWIIAKRARREPNHPDGLKVGEALIGDWQDYGFTRQQYRTALKHLCQQNIIEIIETNRTRKKSTTGVTTGVTTAGTKVRLLNTRVWDINISTSNHRSNHSSNHCPTTAQPLPNHEEEGIRKKKKEKEGERETPPPPVLMNCGKMVKLTKDEFNAFVEKYGAAELAAKIHKINEHYEAKGKDIPRVWPPVIHRWFETEWPDKPTSSPSSKTVESALTFLQKMCGMDRVKIDYGIITVTGAQGHKRAQFDKKDLEGAKKWCLENLRRK